MAGRFKDKIVLVTGASAGIGYALSEKFADEGATLVLTARRRDRLESLHDELKSKGRKSLVFDCDVTDERVLPQLFERIRLEYGRLDVLVANAGFGVVGRIENLTLDDYRRQFETNLYGVIHTVQLGLPLLRESKGRVGVVGSVNGYVALAGNSPYAMSKFAIRAFSEALALEMEPHGVSVTHIAPGFIDTEIRRVDNLGNFRLEAKDKIPSWLQMKAPDAAKRIIDALYRRERERVITGHGHFAVWLARYFPGTLHFLMKALSVEARPEPRQ